MKAAAIFGFLVFASVAFAQTQERKLVDRIMKPEMQMGNPLQKKSFEQAGAFDVRQAGEAGSQFGAKNAYVKDYAFTRSFFGIKNPWFGNKVYSANSADLWSKSLIPNMSREVPVKKAEAVNYWDAAKKANFGSPVVPVNPFIPPPAAQGAVSGIKDKINNKMTIDEVRELLNKPQ